MTRKQEKHESTKKFYFQEIDRIVEFPNCGNRGKYVDYHVSIKCKDTADSLLKLTILGQFLESPEVENKYPHVVGYFKESGGEGSSFKPEYLEIRKICTVEDFWMFLNALNI